MVRSRSLMGYVIVRVALLVKEENLTVLAMVQELFDGHSAAFSLRFLDHALHRICDFETVITLELPLLVHSPVSDNRDIQSRDLCLLL